MAGKILIVDDVATNRIVLKVKLASAHYETIQAATGADAILLCREQRPDLVLLDMALPDMAGIAVCQALKGDPTARDIPVVMISACCDPAQRLNALRAGAEDVYCKPIDELVLLARVRSLLRSRETEGHLGLRDDTYRELGFAEPATAFTGPALIGLVAGQVELALQWKRQLQPYVQDRLLVLDRDAALSELSDGGVPDVFVVAGDIGRPGDGLRFLSELQSRQATRHSAICLVLPAAARDAAATALDLGAGEVIADSATPEEMALRIACQLRAKQYADRLRLTLADGLRLAMIDPLTGLYNRRYGLPHLARIAERGTTGNRPFAVLLIDIDRFKSVNDTFGHAVGDGVLAEVAGRLQSNLRPSDMVARIGGEEFLVVLPDCRFDAAHATAERLRRLVGDQPVQVDGDASLSVTISIGLAMGGGADSGVSDVDAIMAQADRALLAAKLHGRNQVTVSRTAA